MTFKFDDVYVNNVSTVAGPYEKKGPFGKKFDKTYDDFYVGEKTWEKAESKLLEEAVDILLKKVKQKPNDIDVIISGDLLNQICSTSYGLKKFNIPTLGIYSACATSTEGILLASVLIDSGFVENAIVSVSSHNLGSEKQFRNPVEYGAPRPKTATFTTTGGASILLDNKKSKIKVESATIGKISDMGINDANNMGAVMAHAAGNTIYEHLTELKREVDYYDLIITGDLGIYGKEILKDYMKEEYKIELSNNYQDSGAMIFDLKKQKEVNAGGSGPLCSPLVVFSHIIPLMKKKKLKRVLIVATGALFSTTSLYQKESILSISHAVSLEVV